MNNTILQQVKDRNISRALIVLKGNIDLKVASFRYKGICNNVNRPNSLKLKSSRAYLLVHTKLGLYLGACEPRAKSTEDLQATVKTR